MASGYVIAGRGDLDALFMARVNAARANVGYQVGGVDIANRYEAIGSGTPIAATGFQSGGVDLASLFRGINDSLVSFPIASMTANATVSGSTATAVYTLAASGDINATQGSNVVVDAGDWIAPKSGMSGYSVLASVSSGSLSSGTVGSWLALGADVTWTRAQSVVGGITAVIDLQIRRNSDLVVVKSGVQITLTAVRSG